MTSILPPGRSAWDVIGSSIGQNISQNLPGAVQQGYQRQLGLNALQQAEQEIAQAGGDPYKIALAFAKAGAQNPNLERSLGPLMQTAMSNAMVKNAFPNQGNVPGQQQQNAQAAPMAAQNAMAMGQGQQPQQMAQPKHPATAQQLKEQLFQSQPSEFATPSPFNIMTPQDIDKEAQRYATVLRDPNAYQTRYNQLLTQNEAATTQRKQLEDFALKSNVSASELPMFMKVGSKFDTRNPSEWALNAKREYMKAKSLFDKLERTFIPGLGSGILGRDREADLKRMNPSVKDLVDLGLEQETRTFLAENDLTPTEIELQIHPMHPKQEKAIKSIPKGIFPEEKYTKEFIEEKPFISYEEALEKAPQEMASMQNILSNFFLNNVDENTSLLGLRDKILKERDYDWRQIGPAVRQAEQMGLKLQPFQSQEMATLETQPPYDALPYIFRSVDRVIRYLRGNK